MKKETIKVSISYPYEKETTFNMDYYCNQHIPMVENLLKEDLLKITLDKGICGIDPNTSPSYQIITNLYFESIETFQKVFSLNADALLKDIPNYTNIKPVIQINEIVL